jgi:hypothetical protein
LHQGRQGRKGRLALGRAVRSRPCIFIFCPAGHASDCICV